MLVLLLGIASASSSVDLSTLTREQRAVFDAVAAEEFCGCTSALTLAGCLEMRPQCGLARSLGQLIAQAAQDGLSKQDILAYVSENVMGPYCGKAATVDTAGAPSKGGGDSAEITIVEFADFRCGHCRLAAPAIAKATQQLGKQARVIFIPFALQNHPESIAAAEAALAAHAQGKFWPMHDQLFQLQDRRFDSNHLSQAAKSAGLNLKQFEADLAAHKYRDQVTELRQRGMALGIEGTPAFYVNGRPYRLDQVLLTLERRVAMERQRQNGNCE